MFYARYHVIEFFTGHVFIVGKVVNAAEVMSTGKIKGLRYVGLVDHVCERFTGSW
jgi:hypothetical protein